MMKNTAAVCLAAGDAKPPKSDTACVGNHRSDDVVGGSGDRDEVNHLYSIRGMAKD